MCLRQNVLEVRIEVLANGDVAAIVDVEGRLNECIFADTAHDLLEEGCAVRCKGVRSRVLRKVVVVLVHELASTEAPLDQLRRNAVVPERLVSR